MSDRLIALRRPKAALDPRRAYAALWEEEPDDRDVPVSTATIFLTNRECPFRCVMCDLWVNTLDATVPPGAIALQIRRALASLPPARQIKLYNAGSFFDPAAIPAAEDDEIASLVGGFERVIVESHPAFLRGVGADRCIRFAGLLRGRLEVAIGLETANPDVLARLGKLMTLASFRDAASFVIGHGFALRVFVLLNPPFLAAAEAVGWACRSIDEAAAAGAAVCVVIPTRSETGAAQPRDAAAVPIAPARLPALEQVVEYGLARRRLKVFADLWDIERLFDCTCAPDRAARLQTMNREQRVPPRVECTCDDRL